MVPVMAQQKALQGLLHLDKFNTNFACAGLNGEGRVVAKYRDQWQKTESRPVFKYLSIQLPLHQFHGAGGFQMFQDETGLENRLSLRPSYNYVYSGSNILVSSGFGIAYNRNILKGNLIRTPEGDYNHIPIDHHDQYLGIVNATNTSLSFSGSVYVQSKILEGGLEYDYPLTVKEEIPYFKYRQGLDLILAKKIKLSDVQQRSSFLEKLDFEVISHIFSDLIKVQSEFSAQIEYNGNIFGGMMIRGVNSISKDALAVFGGFRYNKKLILAFQFEWPRKNISPNFGMSQEFGLMYNFNTKFGGLRKSKIIYNPRWSD